MLVDECTSGVDPLSRRSLWRTLTSFRDDRCIVLTTHVSPLMFLMYNRHLESWLPTIVPRRGRLTSRPHCNSCGSWKSCRLRLSCCTQARFGQWLLHTGYVCNPHRLWEDWKLFFETWTSVEHQDDCARDICHHALPTPSLLPFEDQGYRSRSPGSRIAGRRDKSSCDRFLWHLGDNDWGHLSGSHEQEWNPWRHRDSFGRCFITRSWKQI